MHDLVILNYTSLIEGKWLDIIFFSLAAAISSIKSYTSVPRKEVNTAISLSLKNSIDWNGRRGRRLTDHARTLDQLPYAEDEPHAAADRSSGDANAVLGLIQQSVNLVNMGSFSNQDGR